MVQLCVCVPINSCRPWCYPWNKIIQNIQYNSLVMWRIFVYIICMESIHAHHTFVFLWFIVAFHQYPHKLQINLSFSTGYCLKQWCLSFFTYKNTNLDVHILCFQEVGKELPTEKKGRRRLCVSSACSFEISLPANLSFS